MIKQPYHDYIRRCIDERSHKGTKVVKNLEREEIKAGLKSAVAIVVFEKTDGSLRTMRCTLMADHLPVLEEGHKARKTNDDVLAVWDLENGGWRSFRIDSIKSISFDPVKEGV